VICTAVCDQGVNLLQTELDGKYEPAYGSVSITLQNAFMFISESPYAYLSSSENEAMVKYHQADHGHQQIGITPVVGTQISMTAPLSPPTTQQ
jgi:hypothetical protein